MFPVEIYDHILDYLYDDYRTLEACALASRVFLQTSRYHRFNGLNMAFRRAQQLVPLFVASPDLAHSITSLSLFHWRGPTPGDSEFAFLLHLPSLREMHTALTSLVYVSRYAPKLTSLHVHGPALWTEDPRELVFGIARFFYLEELELVHMYLGPGEILSDFIYPPAPHLRKLHFRGGSCAGTILQWFETLQVTPPIYSVQDTVRAPDDAMNFVGMWGVIAPVRGLEVSFIPDGTIGDALEDAEFSVATFTTLESCILRFALPEMCVPENRSLPWIPIILAQLSSPHLRTLTISLVVENMEDLRSLNSECAARVLTTAYFDDMRVLKWEIIEEALLNPRLSALQEVVFEGRGSRTLLETHIKSTCPDLHCKGVLSLVTVHERPSWSA